MIGNKIRMLRLKHGYSVSQLSAKANVSKSYLSNLENHKKKNPSLSVLSKVAETLGTTVDDLIGGQDEPSVNDNFYMEELDDEWIRLLKKGVQEGMSKKEFNEFQLYLKFRKKHFH